MQATSINIQAVKGGSEQHNRREKDLDYVRSELSHLNGYWESDSQTNRLSSIKERYLSSTGQRMQFKATPIREGVVVVQENTTMDDLHRLAQAYEDRFGVKVFQIALHKDEGYMNAKEWTPNLHAHLVFDWTDERGKTLKLNRLDMVEMQTLTAEVLGMERGVASDKKHLSSLQFKTEEESKRLEEVKEQLEEAQKELGDIPTIKDAIQRIDAPIKPIEDIFEAHKGWLWGIDTKAVISDLKKREEAKAIKEAKELSKEALEISRLKEEIIGISAERKKTEKQLRETQKELDKTKSLMAEYIEGILKLMGEKFRQFSDEVDKYFHGLVKEIEKVFMWAGQVYEAKGEKYTADRDKGKLLINGETIEQRAARQQKQQTEQESSRGFRR